MKELQDIVAAFEKVESCSKTAALATIVKVLGSTYRRPGARMLMTPDGRMVGSISGGCLEGDVFEHAQRVMASSEPIVVKYDTTSADDIVWGLGLGCNGMVQVLIEQITQEKEPNPMAFFAECLRQQQMGVIVTVFHIEGQVRTKVGTRLMLHQNGTVISNIEDSNLAAGILNDAHEALRSSCSLVKEYQVLGGSAEIFIEVIQPAVPLVIFGAGHDAIPLVRFAKELGWHVTVVDSRPAYATLGRFPLADAVILSRSESIHESITVTHRTVAVVMTHNYLHDREILQTLLLSPLCYLGILGPKSRTERLLQELREEEIIPTNEHLLKLYGPIGLDIGADTPEQIALAIAAEIQAILANRSGGLLRDRKGPIHLDG